jgi:ArsR family transcriptional regulator, arsenate/arsenite/antimonite-responsive transcriptional repressor
MNMGSYICCKEGKVKFKQVNRLSSLLRIVGEENRLKILCILRQRQHCVCDIEKDVDQSQSLTSHHLKDLKEAGLVADEKKGLWSHYSITKKGQKIVDLLFSLE